MHFVFTYEPNPAARAGHSISDQPAHRAWIAKLWDERRLILAGPFIETTGGMAIVEARDRADAEALLQEDPAIANGTFIASIRAMQVIYK